MEWKVPRIKRDSSFSPMSFASRSRISRLALIVNVQQITSCGWYPWCERRYATRAVNVFVLPEPGGASTCRIEPDEVTASRWAWFKPSKIGSMTCGVFGQCSGVCEEETRENATSCDTSALYWGSRLFEELMEFEAATCRSMLKFDNLDTRWYWGCSCETTTLEDLRRVDRLMSSLVV